VSRASSTDLVVKNVVDDDYEEEEEEQEEQENVLYHRHTRDLEIFEIGVNYLGEEDDEEADPSGDGERVNWLWWWMRKFMDFGEDSDEDEIEWEVPPPSTRKRMVSFADVPRRDVDESVVQRARERDEEHGLDGWMDGAAYLAFLGVRAFGGFF